jgi:NADPH-dependent ferric siderophore reductase
MQESTEPRKRPQRVPRRVTVSRIERLTPRMRRISFQGPDLATFTWPGPAAHLKLLFSEEPRITRTYTPRRFDPATLTLEVDFVLHGEGPGSTWAAQAAVGQEIVVMGPARGYEVDSQAAWYVVAGDEAALPAIETLLEAIPAPTDITVFVEVAADDDVRPLPRDDRAHIHWLARGEDPRRAGSLLLPALERFDWKPGEGRVYVGCEADAMRRLRPVVLAGSKLDRTRVVTRGYWRVGEVNHPDHDYAED